MTTSAVVSVARGVECVYLSERVQVESSDDPPAPLTRTGGSSASIGVSQ